jgi:hypothetical protein
MLQDNIEKGDIVRIRVPGSPETDHVEYRAGHVGLIDGLYRAMLYVECAGRDHYYSFPLSQLVLVRKRYTPGELHS